VDLYATCRTPQRNTLRAELTLIKNDPKRTDNKTIESLVKAMKQPSAESVGDFNKAAEQLAQEQSQTMEIKESEKVIDLVLGADSTELSKEFIGSKNFSIETSPAIPGIVKLSLAGDRNVILNTPQVTLPSSGPGNGSFRVLAPGVRTFTISATFSPLKQQDEGAYGTGSLTFVQGITEEDKEEQEEIKDSLQAYLEWVRQPGLVLAEKTDGTRTLRVVSEKRTGVKATGNWGGILKPNSSLSRSTIVDVVRYNSPVDTYLPLSVMVLEGDQPVAGAEVAIEVANKLRSAFASRGTGINSVASENYAGGQFYPTQIKPTTSPDGSFDFIFYAGPTSATEAILHLTHAYVNKGGLAEIKTDLKFPILQGEGNSVGKVEDPIILEAFAPESAVDKLGNTWTIHVGLKRDLEEMKNIKTLTLSGNGEFGPTKSQRQFQLNQSPQQPLQPPSPPLGDLLAGGITIKLEHDKPETPEIDGDLEPGEDYAIVTFTPASGANPYVTARILPAQTTAKNINYTKTVWLYKFTASKKQEEEKKEEPKEVKKYGIRVSVLAQKYEVRTDERDQTILDIKIDPTEGSQSGKIKKNGNPMLVYLGWEGPKGEVKYLESSKGVYRGIIASRNEIVASLTNADPSRLFQVRNDQPSEIHLLIKYPPESRAAERAAGVKISDPSRYWVWIYFKYEGNDVTVKSNSVTITKLAASSQAPEQPETPEEPQQPEEPKEPEEPETPEAPQPPAPPPVDPGKPWDNLLNLLRESSAFSPAERAEIAELINQYRQGKITGGVLISRLNSLAGHKSDTAKTLLFGGAGGALINQLLYEMKNSGEYSQEDLEDAYRAGERAKKGEESALKELEQIFNRRRYSKFWWDHYNDFIGINDAFFRAKPQKPASGSQDTTPSGSTAPETGAGVVVPPIADTEMFAPPGAIKPAPLPFIPTLPSEIGEEETGESPLGKMTEDALNNLIELLFKFSSMLKL